MACKGAGALASGSGQIILVTGGAGYVGSHACAALAAAGFTPVVYDNLSRGHADFVRWGPLERGDIRDRSRLRSVIQAYRPAAALHFAALAYVGESVTEPGRYYDVNVGGSLALLVELKAANIDRLVFSSTCAVYGVPPALPIVETMPRQPVSPYGRSKLAVEQLLDDLARAEGLAYVALRYFNACGAHPVAPIGERHDPETHLIPRGLMAASGEIDALDIFGSDHQTPDGTAVRDYVHVCDLAEAHVAALRYLLGGGQPVAMNLGTRHGHSVAEVVKTVEAVTGRRVPVRRTSRRAGDPPSLVADPALAAAILGFAPARSLGNGVASAWRWHLADRHFEKVTAGVRIEDARGLPEKKAAPREESE